MDLLRHQQTNKRAEWKKTNTRICSHAHAAPSFVRTNDGRKKQRTMAKESDMVWSIVISANFQMYALLKNVVVFFQDIPKIYRQKKQKKDKCGNDRTCDVARSSPNVPDISLFDYFTFCWFHQFILCSLEQRNLFWRIFFGAMKYYSIHYVKSHIFDGRESICEMSYQLNQMKKKITKKRCNVYMSRFVQACE